MKNSKFKILLVLFISIIVFSSCDNEENINSKELSLLELTSKNENLNLFVTAIQRAGLSEILSGSDKYTVFAPSNSAFSNFLAENSIASVNEVPVDVLRELLKNHIISSELRKANLPISGYLKTEALGYASSTNHLSMYFKNISDIVKINGNSTIVVADINAANGYLHIVDHVLELPTIVDHLIANPNLSSLFTTLDNNSQFDFVNELSGISNGPYTMIAPTNSAFTSFQTEPNQPDLSSLDEVTIEKILKYHMVISSNTLSNSLTDGAIINSYAGDSFTIQLTQANFRIKDYTNRLSNLSTRDIQCYNGIIHTVDRILLPNLN